MIENHKRFKKCIIHIGTEKTGSSAIQEHLIKNRKKILESNILYPESAGRVFSSQWEFVAVAQDRPWEQDVGRHLNITDKASQNAFSESFCQSLRREFDKYPKASTLLISSEHFQSRLFGQMSIQNLKTYLEQWCDDFEVVVYFRRQDQLAISFQSTRLKSSVSVSDVSIPKLIKSHYRYFDFCALYDKWARVFGQRAMNARIYDRKRWPGGSVVSDFTEAAGLPVLPQIPTEPNQSLNRKGYHFLAALNQKFPQQPGDKSDMARQYLIREISLNYAGKYYPLSAIEAEQLMERFQEGNEKLRKLAFPNEPAPLFGDDYSEYPEEAEPLEPDYLDAVEIAMDLWRTSFEANMQDGPVIGMAKRILKRLGFTW